MFNIPIVNIYNFVRQSHTHPSIFVQDDFETLKNQIIVSKYYGLPSTIALKYDALMNEKYQNLLKTHLNKNDEISAWWEISEELCIKAGVKYNYNCDEKYDDGISRIYSLGYSPKDRKKLVDAYMEDFKKVFGEYPKTIGSWVLDEVTISYAKEKYNLLGATICRDQLGTDGFSLWGGYMSGPYYSNNENIFLPANKKENQLKLPIFRLLGPDPIYNSEEQVRPGLFGVYTFEPAAIRGRGHHINWNFDRINIEDSLGPNYLQVGQENNFLWPNIRPGYIDQIKRLRELVDQKMIILQTMADSAKQFSSFYEITPPASVIASSDWDKENNLKTINYNSNYYRVSFLIENENLRIRELFIFNDGYKSRYKYMATKEKLAIFDSLPVLNPQVAIKKLKKRPFIRILDKNYKEIQASYSMGSKDQLSSYIKIGDEGNVYINPDSIEIVGDYIIKFDYFDHIQVKNKELNFEYRGFEYKIIIDKGKINTSDNYFYIESINQRIKILFTQENVDYKQYKLINKKMFEGSNIQPIGKSFSKEFENLLDQDRKSIKEIDIINKYKNTLGIPSSIYTSSSYEKNFTYMQDISKLVNYSTFGSLDYIDGNWLAVKNDFEIYVEFDKPILLEKIIVGALFNHRQGIIYPKSISVEIAGDIAASLDLTDVRPKKEIDKTNFEILLGIYTNRMKLIMKDYEIMPEWAFYKGTKPVFNFIDKIYFIRGED